MSDIEFGILIAIMTFLLLSFTVHNK